MEVLRNLWRRKLRTILTTSGTVMGIFTLTTMGSMAEHFNFLLHSGVANYRKGVQGATPPALGALDGCKSRTAFPHPLGRRQAPLKRAPQPAPSNAIFAPAFWPQ